MNALILLTLKIAVSVAFFAAGLAKLVKAKPIVEQFHEFRLPKEIMVLIGAAEVLGAVAIWIDFLTLWAFSCLGLMMLGAVKSHVVAKHSVVKILPSVVLFILCAGGALMFNWLNG